MFNKVWRSVETYGIHFLSISKKCGVFSKSVEKCGDSWNQLSINLKKVWRRMEKCGEVWRSVEKYGEVWSI